MYEMLNVLWRLHEVVPAIAFALGSVLRMRCVHRIQFGRSCLWRLRRKGQTLEEVHKVKTTQIE